MIYRISAKNWKLFCAARAEDPKADIEEFGGYVMMSCIIDASNWKPEQFLQESKRK